MFKILITINLFILFINCFGQKRVYEAGGFSISNYNIVGNVQTWQGSQKYFAAYTTDDIDGKIKEINKVLNDSLISLKNANDISLNRLETTVMDTILNNLDNSRAVFSQEVIKQLREEILAEIKNETAQLKRELLDSLNRK